MGKRKSSGGQGEKMVDETYNAKRARNNEAVKKSREKSRQKESVNSERVQELRTENMDLERQVETLKRELNLLKELFVECAAGGGTRPNSSAIASASANAVSAANGIFDQLDFSSVASSSLSFPEQIVTSSRTEHTTRQTTSRTRHVTNAKKKK